LPSATKDPRNLPYGVSPFWVVEEAAAVTPSPFATGLAALISFEQDFMNLTDRQPFSWQVRFFRALEHGQIPNRCVIPTGLGKTSLLAIWLIAKARGLSVPNRLVYVVNRRTVVDQTTSEAERLRQKCGVLGLPGSLRITRSG
jgi:CRISPR/Cas system-associated endonuclease/helicase Cas3